MIRRQARWYHYLVMPIKYQLVIIMCSLLFAVFQTMVYHVIDKPQVVYQGSCEGYMSEDNAENRVTCGDQDVPMNQSLSIDYMRTRLESGINPTIECVITVSQIFNLRQSVCEVITE